MSEIIRNSEWACQVCDHRFGPSIPFGVMCCGKLLHVVYMKENDEPQSPLAVPAESHTLKIEKSPSGLWFVTGSMHSGLVVTGRTLGEALNEVDRAWNELKCADHMENP